MTKEDLFERLAMLFDDGDDSVDAEEWDEQMRGAKGAIAAFERAAQARAIEMAAFLEADTMHAYGEAADRLRALAEKVRTGEFTIP